MKSGSEHAPNVIVSVTPLGGTSAQAAHVWTMSNVRALLERSLADPGHGPALVCGSWRMARSPPAPWLLHFLSTERHIGEWQTCLNRAGRSPIPQSDATDYDPELVTSSSAYQARGPVLFLLLEREVHTVTVDTTSTGCPFSITGL